MKNNHLEEVWDNCDDEHLMISLIGDLVNNYKTALYLFSANLLDFSCFFIKDNSRKIAVSLVTDFLIKKSNNEGRCISNVQTKVKSIVEKSNMSIDRELLRCIRYLSLDDPINCAIRSLYFYERTVRSKKKERTLSLPNELRNLMGNPFKTYKELNDTTICN